MAKGKRAKRRTSFLEGEGKAVVQTGRRKSAWRAGGGDCDGGAGTLSYRRQHTVLTGDKGPVVERFAHQVPDSEGRPGNPHRVHDTLAVLHRNGTIDDSALDAGRRFEEDFRRAALDTLHARDLGRIRGSGGPDMNEIMLAGREKVARALKALGGYASPGGSALWAVLGQGQTIKEFAAASQLGAGRSLDEKVAKGIVVGALAALAAHYGFSR